MVLTTWQFISIMPHTIKLITGKQEINVLELVQAGGWLMFPILLCSVIAAAIIVAVALAAAIVFMLTEQSPSNSWGW